MFTSGDGIPPMRPTLSASTVTGAINDLPTARSVFQVSPTTTRSGCDLWTHRLGLSGGYPLGRFSITFEARSTTLSGHSLSTTRAVLGRYLPPTPSRRVAPGATSPSPSRWEKRTGSATPARTAAERRIGGSGASIHV